MSLKLYVGGRSDERPRTNLTHPGDMFVGRAHALDALRERMVDARTPLVSVIGPPGVGKTRLAREFGRGIIDRDAFDEMWVVELRDARSRDDVGAAIAAVVGVVADEVGSTALQALSRALRERGRVLLVLDNVEPAVAAVAHVVDELVGSAPSVQALVTSREPLRLRAESRLQLAPLSPSEGVELFRTRAVAVRSDVPWRPQDVEEVQRLVESLDFLPLAIELAAARATVLSPRQIRERLHERFRLLQSRTAQADGGSVSLRGALDWSWDMLSSWERDALMQCTVFRGGFTLEAAEAVVDLQAHPDAPWAVDMLASLFDRSLLTTYRAIGSDQEQRYALYASIRDYAGAKLASGEREAAERRHAEFFTELAEQWDRELSGPGNREVVERFGDDRANVMAVLERFADRDADLCARCTIAVERVFGMSAPFEQLVAQLDHVIAAARGSADPRLLGRLHASKAFQLSNRGRTTEASADLAAAREIEAAHDDADLTYAVKMAGGIHALSRSELDRAETEFGAARDMAIEQAWRAGEGRALIFMGMVASARGDTNPDEREESYELAHDRYAAALTIWNQLGAERFQAALLANIGNLFARDGRRAEQRHYHENALGKARAASNRYLEGAVLMNLSHLAVEEGRGDDAEALIAEALQINRDVGRRNAEAALHLYGGQLDADRQRWPEAVSSFLDGLDITEATGMRWLSAEILYWLGLCQLGSGRFADAMRRFEEARALLVDLGDRPRIALVDALRAAGKALAGDGANAKELWLGIDFNTPKPRHGAEGLRSIAGAIVQIVADGASDAATIESIRDASADDAAPRTTTDQRVLARLAQHLLPDARVEGAATQENPTDHGATTMVVGPDSKWLTLPSGEELDFRRRRVLRRLLHRLVEARIESAGEPVTVDMLIEAGWPGQTFVGDSGANRVYVGISTLRDLGLGGILQTRGGGYLLDPHIIVDRP